MQFCMLTLLYVMMVCDILKIIKVNYCSSRAFFYFFIFLFFYLLKGWKKFCSQGGVFQQYHMVILEPPPRINQLSRERSFLEFFYRGGNESIYLKYDLNFSVQIDHNGLPG